jgi:metallo-beta-lactamase class B
MGFDPKDIKIILHTHGHTDHYGASAEFKRMYGCKLVISKIDAELVKRSNISSGFYPLATLPPFDEEIEDGDIIELGDVKIRCVLTPGHTEGVMSFFFDVEYEGKTYTAGLFGGAGTNAITLPYICKNGYSDDLPMKMLSSIELLKKEKVDIHLGNHPGNNRTLEKREKQLAEGGNPFIDADSFTDFLESLEKKVHGIILENAKLDEEFNSQIHEN